MKTMYWSTIINICLALSGVSGHRIVGGKEVVPHSRPYMVYLEGQTDNAETFLCGGSLIRENVIMTAAHCDASSITAYVGIHSVNQAKRENLGIPVTNNHYPHPNFNYSEKVNDIMLLKLSQSVTLSKTVDLIPYAQSNTVVPVGTACSVAGWGQTTSTSGKSDVLREVSVTIRGIDPLNARGNKGEGACRGDSGSPLVCEIGQRSTAVGVESFSSPSNCDDKNHSNFYSKVSAYYNWIKDTLNQIPQ